MAAPTAEIMMQAVVTERVERMTQEARRAQDALIGLVLETSVDEMRAWLPDPANSLWADPTLRTRLHAHLKTMRRHTDALATTMVHRFLPLAKNKEEEKPLPPPIPRPTPEPGEPPLRGMASPLRVGEGGPGAEVPRRKAYERFPPGHRVPAWPEGLDREGHQFEEHVADVTQLILDTFGYQDTVPPPAETETPEEAARIVRHVIMTQFNQNVLDWAHADDLVARQVFLLDRTDMDWRSWQDRPPTQAQVDEAYAKVTRAALAEAASMRPTPISFETLVDNLDYGSATVATTFDGGDGDEGPGWTRMEPEKPNAALLPDPNRNLRHLLVDLDMVATGLQPKGLALASLCLGVDGIRPSVLMALTQGMASWIHVPVSGTERVSASALESAHATLSSSLKTVAHVSNGILLRRATAAYRHAILPPAATWVSHDRLVRPLAGEASMVTVVKTYLTHHMERWLGENLPLVEYVTGLAMNQGFIGPRDPMVVDWTRLPLACGAAGPLIELSAALHLEDQQAGAGGPPSWWQRTRQWFQGGRGGDKAAAADRQLLIRWLSLSLLDDQVNHVMTHLATIMTPRREATVERVTHEHDLVQQHLAQRFQERRRRLMPAWFLDLTAMATMVLHHGGYGPLDVNQMNGIAGWDMPYAHGLLLELNTVATMVRAEWYGRTVAKALARWRLDREREPYRGILGACSRVVQALTRGAPRPQGGGGGHFAFDLPADPTELKVADDLALLSELQLLGPTFATTLIESLGGMHAGHVMVLSLHDLMGWPIPLHDVMDLLRRCDESADGTRGGAFIRPDLVRTLWAAARPDTGHPLEQHPLVAMLERCTRTTGQEAITAAAAASPWTRTWVEVTRFVVRAYGLEGRDLHLDDEIQWPPRRILGHELKRPIHGGLPYLVVELGDPIPPSSEEEEDSSSGLRWPEVMVADLLAILPQEMILHARALSHVFYRRLALQETPPL